MSISEKERDLLWGASPEMFEEWAMSLNVESADTYHPIYEIVEAIVHEGFSSAVHQETENSDEADWVALATLLLQIADRPSKSTSILKEMKNRKLCEKLLGTFEDINKKVVQGLYIAPLNHFDSRDLMSLPNLDETVAKNLIKICICVKKTFNGFKAIDVARRLGHATEGILDVFQLSLLLHALRPEVFPNWNSGHIFHKFTSKFDHDYAEFCFSSDICNFNQFDAYLDNCFALRCTKLRIPADVRFLVLDYAASLLSADIH